MDVIPGFVDVVFVAFSVMMVASFVVEVDIIYTTVLFILLVMFFIVFVAFFVGEAVSLNVLVAVMAIFAPVVGAHVIFIDIATVGDVVVLICSSWSRRGIRPVDVLSACISVFVLGLLALGILFFVNGRVFDCIVC